MTVHICMYVCMYVCILFDVYRYIYLRSMFERLRGEGYRILKKGFVENMFFFSLFPSKPVMDDAFLVFSIVGPSNVLLMCC